MRRKRVEQRRFYILIRPESPRWLIARVWATDDLLGDARALLTAQCFGWFAVQGQDRSCGPERFRAPMSAEEMRRRAMWLADETVSSLPAPHSLRSTLAALVDAKVSGGDDDPAQR
jgi:hypothetical protein